MDVFRSPPWFFIVSTLDRFVPHLRRLSYCLFLFIASIMLGANTNEIVNLSEFCYRCFDSTLRLLFSGVKPWQPLGCQLTVNRRIFSSFLQVKGFFTFPDFFRGPPSRYFAAFSRKKQCTENKFDRSSGRAVGRRFFFLSLIPLGTFPSRNELRSGMHACAHNLFCDVNRRLNKLKHSCRDLWQVCRLNSIHAINAFFPISIDLLSAFLEYFKKNFLEISAFFIRICFSIMSWNVISYALG